MVDLTKSLNRTTLILMALIFIGWISTAQDSAQLWANLWFLALILIPLVAWFLLKERVRNIPPLEENA